MLAGQASPPHAPGSADAQFHGRPSTLAREARMPGSLAAHSLIHQVSALPQHSYSADAVAAFGRILEEIGSELELRPLLTSIIRHACQLLQADDGTIGLYDPQRHAVRIEAVHRLPQSELGAEFAAGQGLVGQVMAARAPVLVERYGEVPGITLPQFVDNTVLGVPIMRGEEMIGAFGIGAAPPHRFSRGDVVTLELFARHAAIAIQNALRYQREQRRSERMELIARVARLVSSGLEPVELVGTAADVIHAQLGYPNVVIPLLHRDESGEYLEFVSHAGAYSAVFVNPYRQPVTEGITGAAVTKRAPQLINDVSLDPRYVLPPGAIDVTAELAVPIMLGDEVFGCINIEGVKPFDDDDVSSVQIIADHIAVAIKNARLSSEARQAAVMRERQRLARDLHDAVSQALSSISMMSQSLVSAWHRDPFEGERRTRRLEDLSRLAFAEMRALLRELRPDTASPLLGPASSPAGIDDVKMLGLYAALQKLAQLLAPETPSIRLEFPAYERQEQEIEEELYLICREALSNAIRHSRARVVCIRAERHSDRMSVRITDNGAGFDNGVATRDDGSHADRGIGLQTMSERARALGGALFIDSSVGKGTSVEVSIPYPVVRYVTYE